MVNFVCVFRYISILSHHKQNLVVFGIGSLCHDDVKCWSPSSTSTYSKTIFPKLLDIRCVCYNCLICAKIFHKKHSKPNLSSHARKYILLDFSHCSLAKVLSLYKSTKWPTVLVCKEWWSQNMQRSSHHACFEKCQFFLSWTCSCWWTQCNQLRHIRWKWESQLNFLRCKLVQ